VKLYYVYILASFRRVLYIGVTGNLEKRLAYHRSFENPTAFTARYKELKGWRRSKKIRLIEKSNPDWIDLAPLCVPPSHTDPSLRSG